MPDSASKFCVVGDPIQHSRSPEIHALFAKQTGIELQYSRQRVKAGRLSEFVAEFRDSGGLGLNVTVPLKVEAFDLCQPTNFAADRAQAVNTIQLAGDEVAGFNTDGIGLARDLEDNLGLQLSGAKVLMLGAGGATRGVLPELLQRDCSQIAICNRTPARAERLLQQFNESRFALELWGEVRAFDYDLVINATSSSLAGDRPPLPAELVSQGAFFYDMMYAPEPTPLLQWVSEHGGHRQADGLGMLVEQAAESFRIWHGIKPRSVPVIREIRRVMQS
ncbi:MAG: shikimate dehydrogenase [Pseudomonadota bacterium]